MNRVIQKGASAAVRVRSMGSAPDVSKLTPQQITEMGSKINPAQTAYGPKDKNLEKWQKFFQDPLNCEKPVYRRKGASDDMLVAGLGVTVGGLFIYNLYDFIRGF